VSYRAESRRRAFVTAPNVGLKDTRRDLAVGALHQSRVICRALEQFPLLRAGCFAAQKGFFYSLQTSSVLAAEKHFENLRFSIMTNCVACQRSTKAWIEL
jgi:hypothetical protein